MVWMRLSMRWISDRQTDLMWVQVACLSVSLFPGSFCKEPFPCVFFSTDPIPVIAGRESNSMYNVLRRSSKRAAMRSSSQKAKP